MALLELDDLRVTVATDSGPADLLAGVSFAMSPGDTLGIVGESGSGKSLTALSVMGLLGERMETRGRILFEGQDITEQDDSERARLRGSRMAMIFQEPMTALNPVKAIGAQIMESMFLHLSLTRADAETRARRLLDRVGLPAPRFSLGLYPHQLSGGQRQRVMIAMALACDPVLLIADEPTTALDVTIQAQILDLLASIVAESGMALMLITHDLGIVAEMTARTAVMYSGRIVETGGTREVFARMAHPYTYGLFTASPGSAMLREKLPGQRRPRLPSIPGTVPDPRDRPPGCAFAGRCPNQQAGCLMAPPPLACIDMPGHAAACYHPRAALAPA